MVSCPGIAAALGIIADQFLSVIQVLSGWSGRQNNALLLFRLNSMGSVGFDDKLLIVIKFE